MGRRGPQYRNATRGNLALTRNRKKLTQSELANAIGVPQAAVSRMEAGKQKIDVTLAFKIARVLGVDVPHELSELFAPSWPR